MYVVVNASIETGLCKMQTGWRRMADDKMRIIKCGWKNADDKKIKIINK